jgi:predicted metal-dependent hydrolase
MEIRFKKNKKTKEYDIVIDGKKVGASKKPSLPLHELEKMLKPQENKVKVKLEDK